MAAISGRESEGTATILVVDDDPTLRSMVAKNLELGGFRSILTGFGAQALAAIDEGCPDLVLLDVMLPDMDGFEVCRRIRRHHSCAQVPIIMLTGMDQTADTIAGLEAGADDYIVKPFNTSEMMARIRARIRRADTEVSLQPLTRLPGNIAIEREIRRRLAADEPMAVLYLDLDNFKAFNDVYGFVQGDVALVLLGTTLSHAAREAGFEGDFVGHIGGDDFIVVTMPDRAQRFADAVISRFDAEIRTLYTKRDLERGYIQTLDRRGALNRYPIMSLSIAIVSTVDRSIDSYQRIGEVAAELKKFAKSIPGSVAVVDKRRT